MGLQIEDGLGRGRAAGVSEQNRLMTVSKSNLRGYYVSRDDARMFNWVFEDATVAAGHYVAYLLNTSPTRRLVIDLVRCGSTVATVWKVVTATGTATGGNAVTAVNMNRASGVAPEATALADNVGGFTAGTPLIAKDRHGATASITIPFDDTLILGPQNAIAVEADVTAGGEAAVTIRGYFESI